VLAEQARKFDRRRLLEASTHIEKALSLIRFNIDMRLLLDTTFLRLAATLTPLNPPGSNPPGSELEN
jgi:hypothetical protein